jgi:cell division septation protein DedD
VESSESQEPSYYEVALTNRQVLIAFVVLLTSIVAAFLSGVWIGRGEGEAARHALPAPAVAASSSEAPLEQLTFFNGKDPGTRATAPAPAGAPAPDGPRDATAPPPAGEGSGAAAPEEVSAEASATEAMRRNLDATMAANRTVPAPAPAAAESAAPPPAGTRTTTSPSVPPARPGKPASGPAATAGTPKETLAARAPATGKIFVQVYSSTNGKRAREIVAELKKAGFAVAVAETPKAGGKSHRVRVGPYADRSKADSAAARLRREFRLETWVTDSP